MSIHVKCPPSIKGSINWCQLYLLILYVVLPRPIMPDLSPDPLSRSRPQSTTHTMSHNSRTEQQQLHLSWRRAGSQVKRDMMPPETGWHGKVELSSNTIITVDTIGLLGYSCFPATLQFRLASTGRQNTPTVIIFGSHLIFKLILVSVLCLAMHILSPYVLGCPFITLLFFCFANFHDVSTDTRRYYGHNRANEPSNKQS